MEIASVIGIARDVATLLALLIGGALSLFVFFQLAPVLTLRILPRWADDAHEFLVLRFEVENKSRVRVHHPRGRIQVLEHEVKPGTTVSQWVPFEQSAIIPGEPPLEWREPIHVFQTTRDIYPSEVLALERLYHYPQDAVIIHAALQVSLQLGMVDRILTRQRESWRQTTTVFIVKHIERENVRA